MERRDLLIDIAEMYYIQRMSQEEIAKQIDISRSNVSRLLKLCVSEKIVEFKINKHTTRVVELESRIKNHYKLEYIKIVPSYEDEATAKREAGNAAAKYIRSLLEDDFKIGISWGGSTLYNVVEELEPIIEAYNHLSIYQMVGGTGTFDTDSDGPQLTKMLSDKIGAKPNVLNVPLMLQSQVLRDLLLDEPQVREHFSSMANMSLLLMGIGSIVPENNAMYRAGYIS